MTTPRIRTGLRIPPKLNTELILLAKEVGVSKNALILQALWGLVRDGAQTNTDLILDREGGDEA